MFAFVDILQDTFYTTPYSYNNFNLNPNDDCHGHSYE